MNNLLEKNTVIDSTGEDINLICLKNQENIKDCLNTNEIYEDSSDINIDFSEINEDSNEINEDSNEINEDRDDIDNYLGLLFNKIDNAENINKLLIDNITLKLNSIFIKHNKKVNNWYDDRYFNDLNNLKNNILKFCEQQQLFEKKSFIIFNK